MRTVGVTRFFTVCRGSLQSAPLERVEKTCILLSFLFTNISCVKRRNTGLLDTAPMSFFFF